MKKPNKLSIKKITLRDLGEPALDAVAGGATATCPTVLCPTVACPTRIHCPTQISCNPTFCVECPG